MDHVFRKVLTVDMVNEGIKVCDFIPKLFHIKYQVNVLKVLECRGYTYIKTT